MSLAIVGALFWLRQARSARGVRRFLSEAGRILLETVVHIHEARNDVQKLAQDIDLFLQQRRSLEWQSAGILRRPLQTFSFLIPQRLQLPSDLSEVDQNRHREDPKPGERLFAASICSGELSSVSDNSLCAHPKRNEIRLHQSSSWSIRSSA